MAGLTAKVFRTYNASWTMSNLLKEMKSTGTIPEKVKDYNDANRKVAILCNHKRTVAAGHEAQMEKMGERVKGLYYQQYRLKQQMLDLEPKLKKKRGEEYFKLPEELDDEWVKEHQKALVEEQRQKIQKKFEKENEKLVAEGEKEMKAKELEERMEPARELEKKFKAEWKAKGKIEAEGKSPSVEKLDAALEKLDQRIATLQTQSEDRENNKEVALGTSKIVSGDGSYSVWWIEADFVCRTTSTRDSRLCSRRSSMSPSSGSSPRRCGRSSSGRLRVWMRTGSFRPRSLSAMKLLLHSVVQKKGRAKGYYQGTAATLAMARFKRRAIFLGDRSMRIVMNIPRGNSEMRCTSGHGRRG